MSKKKDLVVGLNERLELIRLAFGVEAVRFTVEWGRGSFHILGAHLPDEVDRGVGVGDEDVRASDVLSSLVREDVKKSQSAERDRKVNYYG